MLINLRNALMSGKRLPYDAEVEYLQSTGTQWIDTATGGCTKIEFGWKTPTPNNDLKVYGNSGNGNKYLTVALLSKVYRGTDIPTGTDWDIVKLDTSIPSMTVERNGVVIGTASSWWTGGSGTTGPNIYPIFGRVLYTTGAMDVTGTKFVSYFKAWDANGVLVRDFIPVRKGTTGYLYDRVSGKLFGNAGTGDFVLGPDVVPVEYIESHGTEWIETGVSAVSSPKYSMKIRCSFTTPTSPTVQYWGADNGGTYGLNSGDFLWSGGVSAVAGRVYDIFYQSAGDVRYGEVDGVRYTGSNFASSGYRCLLFCAGQSGTRKTALFAARLYGAEFVSADNLAFKSVPIRVGTNATSWEGAMMDTLTRRIYRNAGTGAFTYGNDLKYPIPAE